MLCRDLRWFGLRFSDKRNGHHFPCVVFGFLDRCKNRLRSALTLHVVQEIFIDFECDAVLLKIFDQLRIGSLVADGVIDVILAHRARELRQRRLGAQRH